MNYPVPATNVAFAEPATNAAFTEPATNAVPVITEMMIFGVFAPFKVRVDVPTEFGNVIHDSYFRVNATWKPGPKTRTETYWVLIETQAQSVELVKVMVASDLGEEMRGLEWDARVDVVNALNGAVPGWTPIPVRRELMTEEPF